jgi:phosphoenolpyruvate carboxykinase (GTP)
MPREGDLDLAGLAVSAADLKELLRVDRDAWTVELSDIKKNFSQFGDRLPERLRKQLDDLRRRLG